MKKTISWIRLAGLTVSLLSGCGTAHFAGQKSAEETTHRIRSKVNLYVNEKAKEKRLKKKWTPPGNFRAAFSSNPV
jgi:hypothetical protein